MTAGQMAPLMSPAEGCALCSLTWQNPKSTLHHPSRCHRQRAMLVCNDSIPICVPTMLADAGRRGAQRSEVKEEAEGRGTRTELSAMSSCVTDGPGITMGFCWSPVGAPSDEVIPTLPTIGLLISTSGLEGRFSPARNKPRGRACERSVFPATAAASPASCRPSAA